MHVNDTNESIVGQDSFSTKQGGKTLYCYLDESGNFDFSDSGTEFYFQSALVTRDPYPLLRSLQDVKYGLYMEHLLISKSHSNNDYFHATEDAPYTRSRVYGKLSQLASSIGVYSIAVKKSRTPLDRREPKDFYQEVFKNLIGVVIAEEHVAEEVDNMLVLTDRIPVQKQSRTIIGSLKKALSFALYGSNTVYTVADMDSKSDFGLPKLSVKRKSKGALFVRGGTFSTVYNLQRII